MSEESKEKRRHEEHHPHHHNQHKHGDHTHTEGRIHPAWYIVLGAILIVIIIISWTTYYGF